jgi:hypothetical protein
MAVLMIYVVAFVHLVGGGPIVTGAPYFLDLLEARWVLVGDVVIDGVIVIWRADSRIWGMAIGGLVWA